MAKRKTKKNMMANKNMEACGCNHHRWHGFWMALLGLLVVLNAYYDVINWFVFVGLVLLVKGLVHLIKPHHCC